MADNTERTEYVTVFRTGKLWEVDLGRDALKEHDVPFFAQTQSLSGVQTALDAAPAMGPGVSWSLLVPREAAERAREVLRSCRLETEKEPGVWDLGPKPGARKHWRTLAWAILTLAALFFAVEILFRTR